MNSITNYITNIYCKQQSSLPAKQIHESPNKYGLVCKWKAKNTGELNTDAIFSSRIKIDIIK